VLEVVVDGVGDTDSDTVEEEETDAESVREGERDEDGTGTKS